MKYEEEYEKINYKDITIYLDRDLIPSDQIEIKLTSNLPFLGPSFRVEGVTVR